MYDVRGSSCAGRKAVRYAECEVMATDGTVKMVSKNGRTQSQGKSVIFGLDHIHHSFDLFGDQYR